MKILKMIVKTAAAGVTAVMILSLIMCCYYILPVHTENEKENTDFVWPANSVWVRATEGIAWGKFDANGYNNMTVVENPDIIVLGSSHMEGCDVMQDQTAAYLLGEKLKDRYTVYNMGISDHDFYKVCQYLPANLELYETVPKVVILETRIVDLKLRQVNRVLKGKVKYTESHSSGLIGTLQKIPFLRMMYRQIEGGLLDLFRSENAVSDSGDADAAADTEETEQDQAAVSKKPYSRLFKYLSRIEKEYGTQIIIVYHPPGTLKEDGTIEYQKDAALKMFRKYAKGYGIRFINMASSFEDMFASEHHVAHGFATGELETGHLNKYGHAAIADALYKAIQKMEEAGEICQ